jgi:hypothetical protein
LAEAWRCSGWMRIWLGDPKTGNRAFCTCHAPKSP